jgi:hypothetical protein
VLLMPRRYAVTELAYDDIVLDEIALPEGALRITLGLGSGLSRAPGDPPGRLWAIGDRGPNLKVKLAVEDYGLDHLRPLIDLDGAKVMPRPDLGPMIVELRLDGDTVEVVDTLRLTCPDGSLLSGLPLPGGGEADMEPTFDLQGNLQHPDGGADTEGLAALADGSFWVADEYGPSILRVDPAGVALWRWGPVGLVATVDPPLRPILPEIAARRRKNRGFEALTVSADEAWLYVAFQSPLAHPDDETGEQSRILRLWKIDAKTGHVAAQYAYELDKPGSFERDARAGDVKRRDLKVCELVWLGPDRLLALERISATAKIYRVDLAAHELPIEHLDVHHRPTLEERDRDNLITISKTLIFSTDDAPEICPDLEGMAVIGDRELILVNDNDFGIEGVKTRFYRVRFDQPIV